MSGKARTSRFFSVLNTIGILCQFIKAKAAILTIIGPQFAQDVLFSTTMTGRLI
jgi:hypothetical protein